MRPDLLLKQRHTLIQKRIDASGRVLAADLADEFAVSEDTIRRDLRMMAQAGLCERVYGGALALQPGGTTLAERLMLAPERKDALARTAVTFLRPGMTVFFDAGSTNLAIARAIPAGMALAVATNTPVIAAALMENSDLELILIGGKLDRQAGAAVGAKAQHDVATLRPDLCILGACGVDAAAGLTVNGFEDAEFKRAITACSRAVLVASTNDKIGLCAPHAVAPVAACTHLVLEQDADEDTFGLLTAVCPGTVRAKETTP